MSNKKATAKSLTSKRLTDFLDSSNSKNKVATNDKVSNVASGQKTLEKYSIVDLEPLSFETDEAPLLFVGKTITVNSEQNFTDIIESYKIFKEMTSNDDNEAEDVFRLV